MLNPRKYYSAPIVQYIQKQAMAAILNLKALASSIFPTTFYEKADNAANLEVEDNEIRVVPITEYKAAAFSLAEAFLADPVVLLHRHTRSRALVREAEVGPAPQHHRVHYLCALYERSGADCWTGVRVCSVMVSLPLISPRYAWRV